MSLGDLKAKLCGLGGGNDQLPGLAWCEVQQQQAHRRLHSRRRTWLQRMFCQGGEDDVIAVTAADDNFSDVPERTDYHYRAPVAKSYRHRQILFAAAWLTRTSATPMTVYPSRLAEDMKAAADLYCQSHVQIDSDKIVLPPILSWHRADFGYEPEQV